MAEAGEWNETAEGKRKDGETEKEARTGVEVSLAEVGEKEEEREEEDIGGERKPNPVEANGRLPQSRELILRKFLMVLRLGAGEGESGNDEEEETKGSAQDEDGGAGGGEDIMDGDGGKGDDLAQAEGSAFKVPEATRTAAEAGEGPGRDSTADLVAEED